MTETIGYVERSHMGHTAFDLDGSIERDWEQHYVTPMATLTSGWPPAPGTNISSGQQPLDTRFHPQDPSYFPPPPHHIPSPHLYPHSDMGTPSSHGYNDTVDSYPGPQTLGLPTHNSGSMHSPQSSFSGVSPYQGSLTSPAPAYDVRPQTLQRLHSAPEPRAVTQSTPTGKERRKRNSDSSDGDYPEKGRGSSSKKRDRIPHTQVERRYRENLNAHLEKLRQTVPSLASRKGPNGTKIEGGEGVRPSKCEILHGAIEHIETQNKHIETQNKHMAAKDKRIMDVTNENNQLKANLEQMQDWIRANYR